MISLDKKIGFFREMLRESSPKNIEESLQIQAHVFGFDIVPMELETLLPLTIIHFNCAVSSDIWF